MPAASYARTAPVAAEAVWALLEDIESWPRWLRAPYASARATPDVAGPVREGTTFALQGSLPYRLHARVVACEPPRRLSFEFERSEYPSDRLVFGGARITVDVEPAGEGRTRVACRHEVAGKGVLGRLYMATVFRPFLWRNVRWFVNGLVDAAGG